MPIAGSLSIIQALAIGVNYGRREKSWSHHFCNWSRVGILAPYWQLHVVERTSDVRLSQELAKLLSDEIGGHATGKNNGESH
jgi:hypothetical protein